MPAHPVEIVRGGSGVDHRHPLGLAHAVNDQVVDHSGVFVEQEAVAAGADGQGSKVLRDQAGKRVQAVRPRNPKGVHVRGVENTRVVAHARVLGQHALVLDRHIPSAEVYHARVESGVTFIKRGSKSHNHLNYSP